MDPSEVVQRINGAVKYATNLPAAEKKYGIVGFCWGGGISFLYATKQPQLSASVVYYGTSPQTELLKDVKSPVLGLYGGIDNRVNATIKDAENELLRLKKSYEKEIYQGAGHAFLRQQDGQEGANMKAAKASWQRTIEFLKKNLENKSSEINQEKVDLNVSFALSNDPLICCNSDGKE